MVLPRTIFSRLPNLWPTTSIVPPQLTTQLTTMTSYLSKLNPIPGFPDYSGPHKVGSIDVELPVSELDAPSQAPVDDIPTVQYRIFYPCDPQFKGKHVAWIPSPQREYLSAYSRFLGAGSHLAEFLSSVHMPKSGCVINGNHSYVPRILHYINIPVQEDAPLLQPKTSNEKWPVMIFSHGLGGSRNAYSHVAGSIASHGVIVIAPEHRDGSTPISFIRDPATKSEKHFRKSKSRTATDYVKLPHTPGPEVENARNAQLKIRLWEIGLIHDSLLKVDQGIEVTNLDTASAALSQFRDVMDVHTPGKITFAGHSFGAATVAQLLKSTYYSPQLKTAPEAFKPLFTPSADSSIVKQVTPQSPLILLDVWCLALRAATSRWLWDLPLPSYAPGGKGGSTILAVESQAFYKWRVHLKATKKLISPSPGSDRYDFQNGQISEPNFFYATTSQHLSQSDFGILFPWVGKRFMHIEDPDRILRLNTRAMLQVMRNSGIEVAHTSAKDMELTENDARDTTNDSAILQKTDVVKEWKWITTDVSDLGDVDIETAASREELENTADAAPAGGDALSREKSSERL